MESFFLLPKTTCLPAHLPLSRTLRCRTQLTSPTAKRRLTHRTDHLGELNEHTHDNREPTYPCVSEHLPPIPPVDDICA